MKRQFRWRRPVRSVVLIEPRSPGYHVYSMIHLPRLGLPILGAILKRAGYDVTILHEETHSLDFDLITRADLVGISTITSTTPRGYALADAIRSSTGVPVFMGGPHVTFCYEEALNYCDFVFRGEPEYVILDFMEALNAGEGFDRIPGLCYRDGDRIVVHPQRPIVTRMETIPDPDFSLYPSLPFQSVAPLMTSRGCPYDCEFCSVTAMFGRQFRTLSIDRVIAGLHHLQELGCRHVFFYDDIFNANPNRLKTLLRRMIQENIRLKWGAQVRVEIGRDPELLELAAASGAEIFYIGFESINPETLKAFNKKQTLEDIIRAIEAIRRWNISIHGMFVIGSDADTPDTADRTVDFALEHRINTIQLMILVPIPGTRLYDAMEREGRILYRDWTRYDGHSVVFQPKRMTPEELQQSVMRAMRRFYSLPRALASLLQMQVRTAAFRIVGRQLIRQWLRDNREWIRRVGELADTYMQELQEWTRPIQQLRDEWARVIQHHIYGTTQAFNPR